MRKWLTIWGVPLGMLVVWFVLARNDINFGTRMFSREMYDEFFRIYSTILGVEREEIPALFAKGLVFDGFLIAGIIAFRKRRTLIPWLQGQYSRHLSLPSVQY